MGLSGGSFRSDFLYGHITLFNFVDFQKGIQFEMVGTVVKRFPDSVAGYVNRALISFVDGLKVLPDTKGIVVVVFLSILVWLSMGFCIYLLFHSFRYP